MSESEIIIEKVRKIFKLLKLFLLIGLVSLVLSNLITFIIFGHSIRLPQFYIYLFTAAYVTYHMIFKQTGDFDSRTKRAERLFMLGLNEKARKMLVSLIKSNPEDTQKADLLIKLGQIYLDEEETQKAERCFDGIFSLILDERRKCERLVEAGLKLCDADLQKAAVKYFEEALDTAFNYINDINIDNSVLEKIIYAYTSNNNHQKANIIYNTLLSNKKVSRNSQIEGAIIVAKYK